MAPDEKPSLAEVERVFHLLLESPDAERAAILQRECDGDEALRAEVEALLDASREASSDLLGASVIDRAHVAAARDFADLVGSRVGPYDVVSVLGEGGFGVVYLAEQREPVRRRVALKVVKPGMDSRAVLARFEQERQALAVMEHPNVARVLDAGMTEQGRPYFAMELVDGEPITTYCDQKRLPIRERLRIFVTVCEAVQHAHAKGIIHRDIKPSNVLVTSAPVGADSRTTLAGMPKIIDFGVAKAISEPLASETIFTGEGQIIGTLAHMSPEQARLGATDIDSRADVYSLGVLLYELLTGLLPFDPSELQSIGHAEALRVLHEEDPPRPSARLAKLGTAAELHAEARQLRADELSLLLGRELEWIPLYAMRKDRDERYQTPLDLASDVRNYLDGLPLSAGPESASYRVRKFVRRNLGLVAAASIVMFVLVGGIVGVSLALMRALDAERLAESRLVEATAAREEAARRADELQVVTEFQSAMLSEIDVEQMGSSILRRLRDDGRSAALRAGMSESQADADADAFDAFTARANSTNAAVSALDEQILSRALIAIESEFGEQPLTSALLRATVGDVYAEFDQLDAAAAQLEEAVAAFERTLGKDDPRSLEARRKFATVLRRLGRFDEAEPLYVSTLESQTRSLGDEHAQTLQTMADLAILYLILGRADDADRLLGQTLETRTRVLGERHPDTLWSMNAVSNRLQETDRLEEAESLLKRTLELRRQVLGEADAETLKSLGNLGNLYLRTGAYEDAKQQFEEVARLRRQSLGDGHDLTLTAELNLSTIYFYLERYDLARPILERVLEVRTSRVGRDHPSTLEAMNNLALLYARIGEFDLSASLAEDARASCQRVLGETHAATIYATEILADTYLQLERFDEVAPLYLVLIEYGTLELGAEHPRTIEFERLLSELYAVAPHLEPSLVEPGAQ